MKIWFDPTRYHYAETQNSHSSCDSSCEDRRELIRRSNSLLTTSPFHLPRPEDLASLIPQKLCVETELYIQSYNNTCWLVCHPTGSGQIAVMDAPAFALLQSFQHPQVSHDVSGDELQAVHLFTTLGFLCNPDAPAT